MQKRCVSQYTLEGVFVKTHSSASEAAKAISVSKPNISRVLKSKNLTAGGYYWRYYEQESLSEDDRKERSKPKKVLGIAVSQYTLDGVFVKTYPNVRIAAEQSYISTDAIYAVLNGKRKTSCGSYWRTYEVQQLTEEQMLKV